MRRTGGDNAVCFESLEKALAENPETYGRLDLVAFGFPCQDISSANPKGKGLAGEKSGIFFECMRIVDALTPAWVLIENVPRLLSINDGRDMATVLQTLAESGYGWSYRILDSQYFGLAQRRKRVFIVGHFGGFCPPEILFEPQGGGRNDKKKREIWERGLCLTTRSGEKQDPTAETLIASTIQASDYKKIQHGQYGNEGNLVAQTLGATRRGDSSFVWQDTHITETNAEGKRKVAGIPAGLDSHRGVVLGNAVSVPVAEWIGKRIMKYERGLNGK